MTCIWSSYHVVVVVVVVVKAEKNEITSHRASTSVLANILHYTLFL